MTISDEARTRANAVITVHKYEPSVYDQPELGPTLTRIHVEEPFNGDISGEGVVEFLQAAGRRCTGSPRLLVRHPREVTKGACARLTARAARAPVSNIVKIRVQH